MKDTKDQKTITRRGFIKGATVAGGAIAGVAMLGGTVESKTTSGIRKEEMGPGSRCGHCRIGCVGIVSSR